MNSGNAPLRKPPLRRQYETSLNDSPQTPTNVGYVGYMPRRQHSTKVWYSRHFCAQQLQTENDLERVLDSQAPRKIVVVNDVRKIGGNRFPAYDTRQNQKVRRRDYSRFNHDGHMLNFHAEPFKPGHLTFQTSPPPPSQPFSSATSYGGVSSASSSSSPSSYSSSSSSSSSAASQPAHNTSELSSTSHMSSKYTAPGVQGNPMPTTVINPTTTPMLPSSSSALVHQQQHPSMSAAQFQIPAQRSGNQHQFGMASMYESTPALSAMSTTSTFPKRFIIRQDDDIPPRFRRKAKEPAHAFVNLTDHHMDGGRLNSGQYRNNNHSRILNGFNKHYGNADNSWGGKNGNNGFRNRYGGGGGDDRGSIPSKRFAGRFNNGNNNNNNNNRSNNNNNNHHNNQQQQQRFGDRRCIPLSAYIAATTMLQKKDAKFASSELSSLNCCGTTANGTTPQHHQAGTNGDIFDMYRLKEEDEDSVYMSPDHSSSLTNDSSEFEDVPSNGASPVEFMDDYTINETLNKLERELEINDIADIGELLKDSKLQGENCNSSKVYKTKDFLQWARMYFHSHLKKKLDPRVLDWAAFQGGLNSPNRRHSLDDVDETLDEVDESNLDQLGDINEVVENSIDEDITSLQDKIASKLNMDDIESTDANSTADSSEKQQKRLETICT